MIGYKSLSKYAKDSGIPGTYSLKQFIKIFEDLSLSFSPQAYIAITTVENALLPKAGFLHIPSDFFRELAMVLSECPTNAGIGIQILHPIKVNDNGRIITFHEYEQMKYEEYRKKNPVQYELIRSRKMVEANKEYGDNIPDHIKHQIDNLPLENLVNWPGGYFPGKNYHRVFVLKKRLSPKEIMDLGYSKFTAELATLHIDPEPEWTKIGSGVFSSTRKILTPENIYFNESTTTLDLYISDQNNPKGNRDDLQQNATERVMLYENLKKALIEGQFQETKKIDERISLIMKELGYDYNPDDGIVRHYSYILADEKNAKKYPLKKLEKIS